MNTETLLLIVLGLVFLPHILIGLTYVLGIACLAVLASAAGILGIALVVIDAGRLTARGFQRIYRDARDKIKGRTCRT